MSSGKKIFIGVLTSLLFLVITFGLPLAAFSRIATNREEVKLILTNPDVYKFISETLVKNVVEQPTQATTEQATEIATTSPDNAALKSIVDKYLTVETFNNAVITIADSTYDWLEGKQEQPTFNIAFAENKEEFKAFLANVFKDRFRNLPECDTLTYDVTAYNPLEAECRPPGYSEAQVEAFINDQAETPELDEFYKNASINSDLVFGQVESATTDNVRSSYNFLKVIPYIVWIVIILFTGLLLLVARQLKAGVKYGSLALLIPAAFVLVGGIIALLAQSAIASSVANNNSSDGQALGGFVKALISPVNQRVLFYSGFLVLLGIIGLISSRFIGGNRAPSPAEIEAIKPEPVEPPKAQ